MQSRWTDEEAAAFLERYGTEHGEDLALRIYTSRLIGRDEDLVLHGGGNTSVKTTVTDLLGEPIDVLCVKGSGWGLVDIEPAGLPAVRLDALRRLRAVDAMSDEAMVNEVRIHLLDASSPTPSVETLLHAFLPHRFVDHSHADAILVLTNQPDGEALIREALGATMPVLPWIMPGFPLAKAVAAAYEAQPDCEGIVLLKHGLFTFGDDARTSYERMVRLVDKAERFCAERIAGRPLMTDVSRAAASDVAAPAAPTPADLAAAVLPTLRGALAVPGTGGPQRFVASWRGAEDLVAFSRHPDAAALLAEGPLTPDHVIRTKAAYLVLREAEARDAEAVRARVAAYADAYRRYFEANRERVALPPTMLDPHPRVVVVAGAGVFAFGPDAKAAGIAGDLAEHTLRAKARAAALGSYEALPLAELFDMEYWSLEQAKLGTKRPPLLAGRIALVTGGAGAIGHGTAAELLRAGAHVLLTDIDEAGLARAAALLREAFPGAPLATAPLDVTDPASVDAAFRRCVLTFGGLDVLVPNAGIAHVSALKDMDDAAFRRVVDVNLTGTMTVLRAAARLFEQQGTGGGVVLQASKNVFAPGAQFGAYSASKAGAAQLGKIAALELAPLGVRVNMINADAVFGDDVPSGLWAEVGPGRMQARGLDPEGLKDYYRDRSLLGVRVTAADVGRAVVFFASEATPTTGATLPVDGGVAAAFPR